MFSGQQPSKLWVTGSNPVGHTLDFKPESPDSHESGLFMFFAKVLQNAIKCYNLLKIIGGDLVEHCRIYHLPY